TEQAAPATSPRPLHDALPIWTGTSFRPLLAGELSGGGLVGDAASSRLCGLGSPGPTPRPCAPDNDVRKASSPKRASHTVRIREPLVAPLSPTHSSLSCPSYRSWTANEKDHSDIARTD